MLQVKVFFGPESEANVQIRRFNLNPVSGAGHYKDLRTRIVEVVGHEEFQLFWKDGDDDEIVFSSEDELLVAAADSLLDDALIRVYVKTAVPPTPAKREGVSTLGRLFATKHTGVVCDGCDGSIEGTRYKCLVCADFDLCPDCERKGIHGEHDVIGIRKSSKKEWREVVARGYTAYGGISADSPSGKMTPREQPVEQKLVGDVPLLSRIPRRATSNWRPWNSDRTVEIDVKMNQPMESLLKDVNNQVMRVLQGFLPAPIEEIVPVVTTPSDGKPQPQGIEVIEEKVVFEEVTAIENQEIATVEHFEQRSSITELSTGLYPDLGESQVETPQLIDLATSVESEISIPTDKEIENGWHYVNSEVPESASGCPPQTPNIRRRASKAEIDTAFIQMLEMGFVNTGNSLRILLEACNGDIEKTVDLLQNQ